MKRNLEEFALFIREKGVLGLALGIIMGGAITKLVNAIVEDLVNPLIGVLTGRFANLEELAYHVPRTDIVFKLGDLLSNFINFVAIAAVVYFIFMKIPLLRNADAKTEERK
jgi:large conductance mechanosensitive channel